MTANETGNGIPKVGIFIKLGTFSTLNCDLWLFYLFGLLIDINIAVMKLKLGVGEIFESPWH